MELNRFLPVARGDAPADLRLRNGRLINVYTGEIIEADIAIAGDTVVGVGLLHDAAEEIDLGGRYGADAQGQGVRLCGEGAADPVLRMRMAAFQRDLEALVEEKDRALRARLLGD